MTKWTYKVLQLTFTKLTSLNLLENLGDEGWELVGLLRLKTPVEKEDGKGDILAIFKQPS
ncbi:MAG TPA: hypothetical protein VGA85_04435 [Dehalococcoidales bacterium]